MMLTSAFNFCEECFSDVILNEEWIKGVLGGSNAKNTYDAHSDIDISIIVPNSIIPVREAILKKQNVLFHNSYEHIVVLNGSNIFDIHLTTDAFCKNALRRFETGEDISNNIQDFLWNISNGIKFFEFGNCPDYKVTYSSEIQKIILTNFLEILSTQKIDVAFLRNDFVQQWECLLKITKVLVNIGFGINKELFWGYKNLHLKNDFPENIQNALDILRDINQKNWRVLYPLLKQYIEEVRIEINKLIGVPTDI